MSSLVRKLEHENTKKDRESLYDKALAYFYGKYLPDFMNSAHFAHTLAGLFALLMVEDLRSVSKLLADKDTADDGLTMLETQNRLDIARLALAKNGNLYNTRKPELDIHDGSKPKKNARKGRHTSSAITSAVVGADNTTSDE